MEFIPDSGTSLMLNRYPLEIMQVKNNMVKTVRLFLDQIAPPTEDQTEPLNDG